jgi:RimJ/RimL family protein N-acetyltransferase
MRADDVEPLLAVFGDAELMRAFDAPPFDQSATEGWVGRNLEHQQRVGYGLFTVVLRTTGEVIGDCGLERMELEGRTEHELGYDLRRDVWGHGLATEAARAVVRHAFEELGLPRLVSLVRTTNRRSARVAEKIGMTPERVLRRGDADYVVFAMERPGTGPSAPR